jgi:uncharacterized protein YjbI with pentapeptide repeats
MAAFPQRWQGWRLVVLVATACLAAWGALAWRGLAGLAVIVGVALAVALLAWVVVMPGRLAPPIPREELAQIEDPKARLEAADARLRLRSDLRNGALQLLAVLAVLAGAVLGFRQLTLGFQQLGEDRANASADRELTRQGQASERFTRAIGQLGDKERIETRVGGIYGLAQVAEQTPGNTGPVGEVLLAYVNRLPRPKPAPRTPLSQHAPDLQAALTVLTQYDKNKDGTKDYAWIVPRLDLSALGLRRADLRGAYLHKVNLRDAYLRDAVLDKADLSGADLYRAYLRDASLRGADLSDADLPRVNLQGTYLIGANLHGADLRYVQLFDTYLRGADLRGADLSEANVFAADLRGADLRGTNFRETGLQSADLRGAKADGRTVWPVGFDWRRAGVRPA